MLVNIQNSSWQFTNDIQSNFANIEVSIVELQTKLNEFIGDPMRDPSSFSLIQRIQILEEENNEFKQRLDQLEFLLQEN
jgi:hypothetical protein